MSTPVAERPGVLRRVLTAIPPEPSAPPIIYSTPLVGYVAVVSTLAVVVAALTVRAPFHLPTLAIGAVVIVALGLVMVRSFGGVSAAWSPIAFVHLALSVTLGPPGALLAAVVASVASVVRSANRLVSRSAQLLRLFPLQRRRLGRLPRGEPARHASHLGSCSRGPCSRSCLLHREPRHRVGCDPARVRRLDLDDVSEASWPFCRSTWRMASARPESPTSTCRAERCI